MSANIETTGSLTPIAITGIGLVSAAGLGAPALRKAMRAGRTFLGPVPRLESGRLPMVIGGAVQEGALGFGPTSPGEGRIFKMCARASEEAYLDAGLREWSGDQRTGISLGTAMGEVEELEILAGENSLKNGASHVAARRRAVPHQDLTERLAVRLGLRGPCSTFSMTCASGLGALEQSVCDLRLRRAEAMLLGGADTLSRFMQAGFCSLKALSPTGQVQPFQKGHDGIVLGEGAAFVLLEELEPARRRGASVYGVVAGNHLSSDATHLTSPDESGEGMARAIRRVMEESGMVPRDIGAITVTATGSPVYDQMQSRAVRLALAGEADRIPVTTWEPAIGHALASTAVLGLVHAAQSLREKSVLPFRHEGESDPACSLRHLREPMPLENRAILALTVGFGGQNGATLISPPPVEEKS